MNDKGINVLEQYDIQLIRTGKGRGSVLCETADGLKMLKEFKGSYARLELEDKVLNHLRQEGVATDSYLKNKTGQVLSIDTDGTKYTLKNWFDGREIDVKNTVEILLGARMLGRLHSTLSKLPNDICESLTEVPTESLEMEMVRHHRELKRVRTFIRNKHKKEEFEIHILKNYERFYAQGEDALARLKRSPYEYLREQAKNQVTMCHGNYNQHNIWMVQKKMVLANFDRMYVNLQIMDLYLYMRKILEKYNGDIRVSADNGIFTATVLFPVAVKEDAA